MPLTLPVKPAAKLNLRVELLEGRHALDPGRVPELTEWLADRARRIPSLIELLWDDDAGVASRAADLLERATRDGAPALLRSAAEYKEALIGLLPDARFIKLRWNLAFVLPRLPLTHGEARRIGAVLQSWLDDRSSIVKTAALQGLADLTRHDVTLLPEVLDMLRIKGRSGTPAMRARSRILLKKLDRTRA